MKNIVIIGMPGSGKTTFGSALAARLGRDFIDADVYLEEREGKTIPELFAVSEDCFRDAETRTARELAAKKGIVIATGGGVIKRPENIDILRKTGVIIFLDRSPDDIVTDVNIATRPLLASGKQRVYDLYEERIQAYQSLSDYHLKNTGKIEDVLDRLLLLVQPQLS